MRQIIPYFIFLICLYFHSETLWAQPDFDEEEKIFAELWTSVDTLVAQQLDTDRIISAVDSIKFEAEKTEDIPNIVRSIYYKAVLLSNVGKDGRYDGILYIESELEQKDGMIVPLLQSILADFYVKLADD